MTRLMLFLSLALVFAACEQTVDVDFPRHAPRIAVNSFFFPDAPWEVHLSEARSVSDGERAIRNIEQATVEILADGVPVVTLPYMGDGLYRAPQVFPAPDVEYTVQVTAPDYDAVSATDRIPETLATAMTYDVLARSADGFRVDIDLTITDPPDASNYYRLMVYLRVRDENGEVFFYDLPFRSEDPVLLAYSDLAFNGDVQEVYFADPLFAGRMHTFTIQVEESFIFAGSEQALLVDLYHVSDHFYQYARTYQRYEESYDNPFAEPVQVHTNINDGFGIFAGFRRYRHVVPL